MGILSPGFESTLEKSVLGLKNRLKTINFMLALTLSGPAVSQITLSCGESLPVQRFDLTQPKDFFYPLEIQRDTTTSLLIMFAAKSVPDRATLQGRRDGNRIDIGTTGFMSDKGTSRGGQTGDLYDANAGSLYVCGGIDSGPVVPIDPNSIPKLFSDSPKSTALLAHKIDGTRDAYRLKVTGSNGFSASDERTTDYAASIFCIQSDLVDTEGKTIICNDEEVTWSLDFKQDTPFPHEVFEQIYDITRYDPDGTIIAHGGEYTGVPMLAGTYKVVVDSPCVEFESFERTFEVTKSDGLALEVTHDDLSDCDLDAEYDFLVQVEGGIPPLTMELTTNSGIIVQQLLTMHEFAISGVDLPKLMPIILKDSVGCKREEIITIDQCCPDDVEKLMYIPSAFSPNDDASNESLSVYPRKGVIVEECRIYDRRGNQIYSIQDSGTPERDGTFRGRDCLPGIYILLVKVDCPNGEQRVFYKNITLLK